MNIHLIKKEKNEGGLYTGKELRTILLCIATSFSLVLNHNSMGKLPMAVDLSKFVPPYI